MGLNTIKTLIFSVLQKQRTKGHAPGLFNGRFALPGLANYILFTDFPPFEHILYVFSLL
jgi:hypothetical protein